VGNFCSKLLGFRTWCSGGYCKLV